MFANLKLITGKFEWDYATERREKREQGVANYYKGQKTITELLEKDREVALLLNNVIQQGLDRLKHGNAPGNWCTSVSSDIKSQNSSVPAQNTATEVQCTASNTSEKAVAINACNVSKDIQSSAHTVDTTFKENYEAEVSQFPSPIPVPVKSKNVNHLMR